MNRTKLLTACSVLLALCVLFALAGSAAGADVMGDVNGNGSVDVSDARLILRHAVRLENFTQQQKTLADLNNDSSVTTADARLALRLAVGLDGAARPEQPTEPDEPTTENPLNYLGEKYSPERAGLIYDQFGYISTYEAINEGDIYYYYAEDGYRFAKQKPYSPGNEPVYDLTKCSKCGKKTQPHDGEHFGCYYGYCESWLMDKNCPECGVFVKANTCHTCGQ